MQKIKVTRDQLVFVLRENRNAHRETFEAAIEAYRVRVIEHLDEMLASLKAGILVDTFIRMPVPQDHTKDYERILREAEMSVEDVLELTDVEFQSYVMDEWAWKHDFAATNAAYGVTN